MPFILRYPINLFTTRKKTRIKLWHIHNCKRHHNFWDAKTQRTLVFESKTWYQDEKNKLGMWVSNDILSYRDSMLVRRKEWY
jgi:hypothetical protein